MITPARTDGMKLINPRPCRVQYQSAIILLSLLCVAYTYFCDTTVLSLPSLDLLPSSSSFSNKTVNGNSAPTGTIRGSDDYFDDDNADNDNDGDDDGDGDGDGADDDIQIHIENEVQSIALSALAFKKDGDNVTANENENDNGSVNTLVSEVEKISHIPAENKIVVQFVRDDNDDDNNNGVDNNDGDNDGPRMQRNCRSPRLFGRLSGPYVTLIQWETQSNETETGNDIDTSNFNSSEITRNTTSDTNINGTVINSTLSDADAVDAGAGAGADDNHDLPPPRAIQNQIVGYYTVPSPGRYFIEIIGLLCNDLEWDASFQYVCLEDPDTHRLTDDSAFIDVVTTTGTGTSTSTTTSTSTSTSTSMNDGDAEVQHTDAKTPLLGYWKWMAEDSASLSSESFSSQDIQRPLLTRYQPQGCRSAIDLNSTRCQVAMSRDRFDPYQYVFHQQSPLPSNGDNDGNVNVNANVVDLEDIVRTKLKLREDRGEFTLFCFVGLSHAREMAREVREWLRREDWNISSTVITAKNLDAQFPRIVNPYSIRAHKCSAAIIAAGQWSAGRKPPGGKYRNLPPTQFSEYEQEVENMIVKLKQSGIPNIHLRSIHYNALGDVKTTCPPQDWRSPPVIERYNDIIRNLSMSMNISYIDTGFIIGPLWDISEDFCHYRYDKVAKAEALYMLDRMLPDE